ncbi:hypothetical protein ACHAXT_012041 [Thalassiosira profunda]
MQFSSFALSCLLAGTALLASAPTVDAAGRKLRAPQNADGGTSPSDQRRRKLGDFQDGFEAGKRECKDLWHRTGSECWTIEQRCTDEFLDGEEFFAPEYGDSPSEKSYKRGGKKGVAQALREIETFCFANNVSRCDDLGENAAEAIAFDHCEIYASHGGNPPEKPSYKEQCRAEAIDVCKGNMIEKINNFCPGKDISYEELQEAKAECEDTVNDLIGWSETRNLKKATTVAAGEVQTKGSYKLSAEFKKASTKKAAPKNSGHPLKTAPKKKAAPKKKSG